MLNDAGTVYTKKSQYTCRACAIADVKSLTQMEHARRRVRRQRHNAAITCCTPAKARFAACPPGKYLVDDNGTIRYFVDPAINGKLNERDDGTAVSNKFEAPKTRLMALIIDGILNGKLPWELVLIGALIAVVLELAGVPSLPFAVGVYLPIQTSAPIFIGGLVRLVGRQDQARQGRRVGHQPRRAAQLGLYRRRIDRRRADRVHVVFARQVQTTARHRRLSYCERRWNDSQLARRWPRLAC